MVRCSIGQFVAPTGRNKYVLQFIDPPQTETCVLHHPHVRLCAVTPDTRSLSSSCPSSLSVFRTDVCPPAATFSFLCVSVPRCICRGSNLSLQKAQRKKIRKLALMKTRSTVSLAPSPPPFSPSFAMNLERRERRRIKVNSNQLSAAPDDRALKCKCACVSFSLSPRLFYERRGKALKLCSLTSCWLVCWALLPLKDSICMFFKMLRRLNQYWSSARFRKVNSGWAC